MDSFLLQKQIRDNASDLQEFCKDIAEWGEEMKQKEKTCEPKRQKRNEESKEKIPKSEKKAAVPIQGFDYSAWDKYDVEAECAKLDENVDHSCSDTSGDLSDEFDENYQEQAIVQKEKGNQCVKNQKWDDAIKCYTQAIEYYGYDPIFYANRALCHLKKENFKAAESDCTVALQLDKTYVKAYQRRAAARERLNQLEQAHDDLLKVFDYEPNNKESKVILAKLERKMKKPGNKNQLVEKTDSVQKSKSKFTISRSHMKKSPNTETLKENDFNDENELRMECEDLEEKVAISDCCDTENVKNIYPILKPAHLRSTKTLKRIKIKETNDIDKGKGKIQSKIINNYHSSTNLPIVGENKTLICDNLKIVERQVKETKPTNNQDLNLKEFDKKSCSTNKNEISFVVPQTSVQFLNDWTRIKDFSVKCEYLKKIKPEALPKIFKHSLESNAFTDLIKTIVDYFNERDIYDYLKALTEVRRFATLIMFMTLEDKKYVTKAMNLLKTSGCVSNQEIEVLIKKYEIE